MLPERTRTVVRVDPINAGSAVHAGGVRTILVVGLTVLPREAERTSARI